MSATALAEDLGDDGLPVRTWQLHEVQRRVLFDPYRFKALPAGRRMGKSDVGAKWCLKKAREANDAGIEGVGWVVYPTFRVARTAWRKFQAVAPRGWITGIVGTENHPDTIRCGSVAIEFRSAKNPDDLVAEGLLFAWLDECGTIARRAWSESIRPTLVDHQAPGLFTGTPKGAGDWFWEICQRGLSADFPEYMSYMRSPTQGIPSFANPFVNADELRSLAAEMPKRTYDQEVLALFLAGGGGAFRNIRECVAPLCTHHKTVALGVDVARSMDFTVLIGMCRFGHVTYYDRFNEVDWPVQKNAIVGAWRQLGRPFLVIDATHGSVGDPIAQDLQRAGIGLEAFEFKGSTKPQLIESLIMAFDVGPGRITIPDETILVNELQVMEPEKTPFGYTRYAAPEGGHDDSVMALALAYRGATIHGGDLGITLSVTADKAAAEEERKKKAGEPTWVCALGLPRGACRPGLPCCPKCGLVEAPDAELAATKAVPPT